MSRDFCGNDECPVCEGVDPRTWWSACQGGETVGIDWVNGLVLHEGDETWHRWEDENDA